MNQANRNQQRLDIRIPAFEKYAYCLCLHVKPATIFIAVIKLIRALLFASIVINNEFTFNDSINDPQYPQYANFDFDTRRSTASAVTILILMMIASVSALGIYSVISGKASLLMPLYAIMLCDFFFALPAFYNRDLDHTLADGLVDLKSYWPQGSQNTRYSLMLVSTIIMLIKIYFLCVIWKCYRYLRMQEILLPIHVHEIFPPHFSHHHIPSVHPDVRVVDSNNTQNIAPPPYDSIVTGLKSQPPNYEEAMKTTVLPYQTNIEQPNTQHQASLQLNNHSVIHDLTTQSIPVSDFQQTTSDDRVRIIQQLITRPEDSITDEVNTNGTPRHPVNVANINQIAPESTSVNQ